MFFWKAANQPENDENVNNHTPCDGNDELRSDEATTSVTDHENSIFDSSDNETLRVILNDLKLRGDNENKNKVSDSYKTSNVPYDAIIHINSLADLNLKGWEIVLGERAKNIILEPEIFESKDGQQTEIETNKGHHANSSKIILESAVGVVVSVIGAYNRGKTFLLNQLCHISLPTGNLMHTEGVSITAGRENYTKIVFLDTAGADTPVKLDALECKRATDALLRELVLHLCSFIIIVVNRLRASDQMYIQQILKFCRTTNKKLGIIIVHNFFDLSTLADIEKVIKEEVESIFGAKQDEMQISIDGHHRSLKFFQSKQEDITVYHFVLAQAGSEAAEIWNIQSLDGIMNIFQTCSEYKRPLNVISNMIDFINSKLPQLLVLKDDSQNSSSQQNLQIVQHNTQPYIVLSDRKQLENFNVDLPCKLDLVKPIVYDDSGYFIRPESGNWQPRHNLYGDQDHIYVVCELPGFDEGKCKIKYGEETVVIEGTRDDLKKSPTDVILHQSEIPSGSFKLEIPLTCEVDTEKRTVKRNNGLVTITLPKKKPPMVEESL